MGGDGRWVLCRLMRAQRQRWRPHRVRKLLPLCTAPAARVTNGTMPSGAAGAQPYRKTRCVVRPLHACPCSPDTHVCRTNAACRGGPQAPGGPPHRARPRVAAQHARRGRRGRGSRRRRGPRRRAAHQCAPGTRSAFLRPYRGGGQRPGAVSHAAGKRAAGGSLQLACR